MRVFRILIPCSPIKHTYLIPTLILTLCDVSVNIFSDENDLKTIMKGKCTTIHILYIACSGNVMANIEVNFDYISGKIKPMHAVNNMPTLPYDDYGWDDRLVVANIPFGRLHDTGGSFGGSRYVDVPNIFKNFDADENDPDSYDFSFTDVLISRMVKSGVMPYYRLGVSIENYQCIKPYNIYPPKDPQKWARICEHIILHYNEGWACGYHFNIKYWEIWNEPDNYPDVEDNQMWKGSMEEFFELYEITSKHLKSCFSDIKIGGYGSCGFYAINNTDVSKVAASSPRYEYFIEFFHKFLEYAQSHNVPIDFFDWHTYASLSDNILFSEYPRKYLDKYGYTDTEIHIGEWNPGINLRGTLKDASNILSMMIGMHSTSVDMMMYYDFRWWSHYCGAVNPITCDPFKAYYAFYAYGQLYDLKSAVNCACDDKDIYVLAAKDKNKCRLLICNSKDEEAEVNISGVSPNAKIYLTDENHTYEEIASGLSSLKLSANAFVVLES